MRFYSIFQVQRLKDEIEITLSSSVADIEYCIEWCCVEFFRIEYCEKVIALVATYLIIA